MDAATDSKPLIKAEPDIDMTDSATMDADLYEDAGDLDMAHASQASFLARIPKYLWQYLTPESGGEDGRLGTIRVEGSLDKPLRLSLMLYRPENGKSLVPLEYNLEMIPNSASSTFFFTEQDRPGFQKKGPKFNNAGQDKESLPYSQAMPRQLMGNQPKAAGARVDKNQRFQGGFRRAIPKRTALAGKVTSDINCLPVENEAYKRVMASMELQNAKPVRETQVYTDQGFLNRSGNAAVSDDFIKAIGTHRPKGNQEMKATRIARNDLLDLLLNCFKRYKYWPLKALKAELRQPEAYLKDVLDEVATLMRQGPHAMTWRLKDAYNIEQYAGAADTQAPRGAPGADGLSDLGEDVTDEDGENAKMEDVLM